MTNNHPAKYGLVFEEEESKRERFNWWAPVMRMNPRLSVVLVVSIISASTLFLLLLFAGCCRTTTLGLARRQAGRE
jgi:hypothetical protein